VIIHGICRRAKQYASPEARQAAIVSASDGIIGNFRGRGGSKRHRQITLLSLPQWRQACAELGIAPDELSWMERRADIGVTDVIFGPDIVGKRLRLGSAVIVEVTGETAPCERMDALRPGLKDALAHWRGGVCCKVILSGVLRVNDSITIIGRD
jgi:MOSC domain-containing protein YiiM